MPPPVVIPPAVIPPAVIPPAVSPPIPIRASGLATVRLTNAVFFAHHGVMPEEHRIGGRFEVDVAMDLDVTDA
ncbi:MAG: dihydroneopterin aldolase, partial [Bacteroidota bacterium]